MYQMSKSFVIFRQRGNNYTLYIINYKLKYPNERHPHPS